MCNRITPCFPGPRCDMDINECVSSPCQNGGKCIDAANRYHCLCPDGFAGPRCETNLDECLSAPCLHGRCPFFFVTEGGGESRGGEGGGGGGGGGGANYAKMAPELFLITPCQRSGRCVCARACSVCVCESVCGVSLRHMSQGANARPLPGCLPCSLNYGH